MSTWIRDRGLLLANLALFLLFFFGMALTGFRVYNDDQFEHRQPATSLGQYLVSETSPKPPSRTGRASSCRWACMSC